MRSTVATGLRNNRPMLARARPVSKLAVEPQQVVLGQSEAADGRF